MSEFTPVGSCKDTYGDEIIVERTGDGNTAVTFVRRTSGEHFGMILSAQQLAEFRELLDRAAMPGQAGADAYGPHECSFPCNPPGGTFWSPGPCTTCGKPYAVAQAESQLAEAQAALAEAHGQVSADDRS